MAEERLVLRRRELMVHGQIAEIEETVPHARVLPVHYPQASVIEEVRVEEVVVTERLRSPRSGQSYPLQRFEHRFVVEWQIDSRLRTNGAVHRYQLEGVERRRHYAGGVHLPQHAG